MTDIATREAALFVATQSVTTAENALKQLMLKDPQSPDWSAQITPTDTPVFDTTPVDLSAALDEAHKNRPELLRLNLQKEINGLDLRYFRNQTRPQVDLVGAYTNTGLAGTKVVCTQANQANCPVVPANLIGGFGQDLSNLGSFGTREINVGVAISIPLRNRAAKANLAVAEARLAADQAGATTAEDTAARKSIARANVQLAAARQNWTLSTQQHQLTVSRAQAAVTTATRQLASDQAAKKDAATIATDTAALTTAQQTFETAQLDSSAASNQASASISTQSGQSLRPF